MEYEDFLDTWTIVHRVRLFDPSWIMSSLWINANLRGPASAWDYGDVSCMYRSCLSFPGLISDFADITGQLAPESHIQDASRVSGHYCTCATRRTVLLRTLRLTQIHPRLQTVQTRREACSRQFFTLYVLWEER